MPSEKLQTHRSGMSYIPRQVPKSPQLYQSRHQRNHSQHRHRRGSSSAGPLQGPRYKAIDQPVFIHRNTSIVRLETAESDVQSISRNSAGVLSVGREYSSSSTRPSTELQSKTGKKSASHAGRHSIKSNGRTMQPDALLPLTRTEADVNIPATGARNWLGIPRVKILWSVAADASPKQNTSATRSNQKTQLPQPWASADLDLLARTSLDCWKRGRQADCEKVAKSLQRSAKDVRTTLQLMLQDYVVYARKTHWAVDQALLINEWAAAEFPKCAVLNAKQAERQKTCGLAAVEKYISVLMCRSHKAVHLESLVDMSAYKRDLSSTQAIHPQQTTSEPADTKDSSVDVCEAAQSISDLPNSIAAGDDSIEAEQPVERTKQYYHLFTAGGSETPSAQTRPTTADAADRLRQSSRKSINLMTRNSRRRKQRTRKAQPLLTYPPKDPRSSATTADSAQVSEGPAELSQNPAKSSACKENAMAAPPQPEKVISAHPNNHTIAIQKFTDVIDDSSNDAELSPELSRDTHDISRLDGDIDMHFFDVTAAHRRFIRSFVDSYVERYFDAFYFRIAAKGAGPDRLCYPLQAYVSTHQSIADASLLCELEKDMLVFNAMDFYDSQQRNKWSTHNPDLSSCNRHFHMCLLRAVERCKIYENDANWPSVDAYATAVYNRIIEDVGFLFSEGQHSSLAEFSPSRETAHAETVSEYRDIANRLTPFKHRYYLGIMATMLTTKYIQKAGRRPFLERALLYGYRPVPTAIDFDNNLSEDDLEIELEMPSSDVAIRGELHNMVMELMPNVSNESTMVAMQRSIEVYNKSIVEYIDAQNNEASSAFAEAGPVVERGYADQNVLETIRQSGGTMTVETTCILARWLSDLWFDRLKKTVLRALMVDHQFRPVPLADVRRWIFEDRSPNGKCIDFILNTRLYNYLKNMRVLMNETKWLFASAAATLRVIELVYAQVQNKRLLEHASVEGYARSFGEFITKHTVDARKMGRRSVQPHTDSACSMTCALAMSPNKDVDSGLDAGSKQTPEQLCAADSFAQPNGASQDCATGNRQLLAEERLAVLELEVADIRKKIQGVSGMQSDINEILGILRAKAG